MTQVSSDWRTKLQKPTSNGLVGNIQAPLRKQILYVSIAQSEASIESYGVADKFRWEAMMFEGDGSHPDMLH
jgi:hypothetical protein